jgi:hypothetical protein
MLSSMASKSIRSSRKYGPCDPGGWAANWVSQREVNLSMSSHSTLKLRIIIAVVDEKSSPSRRKKGPRKSVD